MIFLQKSFDKCNIFSLLFSMSCLSTERRAQYQAQLTALTAYLDALDTAITNGVLHIEAASLDTGEGKQTMKYRSMGSMIKDRELIQSQVDRLINILNGTGLVNANLRRKGSYSCRGTRQ